MLNEYWEKCFTHGPEEEGTETYLWVCFGRVRVSFRNGPHKEGNKTRL